MKVEIFKEDIELSHFVASRIKSTIQSRPGALLSLASGNSPLKIFEELISMNLSEEIDFSYSCFVSLDEWIGLGINQSDSCVNFMDRYLFSQINLPTANICFFDGESNDPYKECARIDQFIASRGGIDFLLLGVGMNGHMGLNEPGVNPDLYSHVISIDEITKKVAQEKYFEQPVDLDKGITLGIRHIMEAKEVVIIINGKHKAEICKKILQGEISNDLPATLVRNHPNATFCLDKDAASLL
jgi:glucosamine-6-phosphate isomerase